MNVREMTDEQLAVAMRETMAEAVRRHGAPGAERLIRRNMKAEGLHVPPVETATEASTRSTRGVIADAQRPWPEERPSPAEAEEARERAMHVLDKSVDAGKERRKAEAAEGRGISGPIAQSYADKKIPT